MIVNNILKELNKKEIVNLLIKHSCRENHCMKSCTECPYIAIFPCDAERIVDILIQNNWIKID